MIDYQTALRLKDAGYNQQLSIGSLYYSDDIVRSVDFTDFITDQNFLKIPIVSELIEVLANKGQFHILEKIENTYYCKKPNKFNDNDSNFILSEGSSAEMALANLYLYYNEPKQ